MEWLGSQEHDRFEGKYAEERQDETKGGGGEGGGDSVHPPSPLPDPFGLSLFSDDSASQDVVDEWEDTYSRPADQQRKENIEQSETTDQPPPASSPSPLSSPLSSAAAGRSHPVERGTALIDLVSCADEESDVVVVDTTAEVDDDGSQSLGLLPSSLRPLRKRRRLVIDDSSQPSSPAAVLSPPPVPCASTGTALPHSTIAQQSADSSSSPPEAGEPFDQWCGELLAQLDEDLQLRFDTPAVPSELPWWLPPLTAPLPPWQSIFPLPPTPPTSLSLPFPRPLRSVQPLSAASTVSSLLPDHSAGISLLRMSDCVCLFGSTYWIESVPSSLPTLFEHLESTLLSLHCSLLECPLPVAATDNLRSDVSTFLSFLRSYTAHVLPVLSSLQRSLFVFVLETCCMLSCERLLVMRLPAFTTPASVSFYYDVLHSFLLVHAHMLQLHAVLVAHRGPSSSPLTIHLPTASSPSSAAASAKLTIPPAASRWPLSSYLFYLTLDLLSLHQRFPSIGRLKQAEGSQAGAHQQLYQPILSLWHTILSYSDQLHDKQYMEPHDRSDGRGWSTDEHYHRLFCQDDVDTMASISAHWDTIESAPVIGGRRTDESDWMGDVEDERPFPCFYQLFNTVLVPFLTDPLFNAPPCPSSLLLLSLQNQPLSRADCYNQCGVQGADVILPVSREQLCDRVEVVWETLIDCIIPAYTLPSLVLAPPSCAALSAVHPADMPSLCASYSLYDTLSDLDTSRGASLRCRPTLPAGEGCACRPHWSLLSFLLRVGLHHVSADYRPSYPTTILSRLSSIVHVWPCIDADRLMLSLYQLADLSTNTTPPSLMSHSDSVDSVDDVSEERLECWPGSLLADDVLISLASTGSDKRWQQYLRVMFVYLRLMAEAKPAPSPIALSPPSCTLQHNNSSHHGLLFHSFNTLPRVLSSLYLSFQSPSPPPRFTCDCHGQLERLSQQVSIHLLAALVSPEAASRASSHLNRLMDFEGSCYHAQSFMLRCWSALASLLIKHALPMGDTLRGFLGLLCQSIQLHMDAEEDAELRQCELWNEPREWSDELKREKHRELRALRDQLRHRRKRMALSLGLLRRLMQRRFAVDGCVEADYLTMLGVAGVAGGSVGAASQLSQSFLFDLLDMERPVPLSMRMVALKLVEDTLLCLQVPPLRTLHSAASSSDVHATAAVESASQESDEGELAQLAEAVQEAEQQRALSKRRESMARLLPFLDTISLQLIKRMAHYFAEANQQQAALLLLNPHRASLVADIAAGRTSLASYSSSKRTHRTTKSYHRRQGDNNIDDAYRINRDMLMLCTRLHADIAHLLIQAKPQQAAVTVREFGLAADVQLMEQRRPQLRLADIGLFRYRFLLSYHAFLTSNTYDRATSIQLLLKPEFDRAALVRSVLCALTESDELDMPREELVAFLRQLLPSAQFLPYQQPAVDVRRVCASQQSLQQTRIEVIDSLVAGMGSLVNSSSSSLSSPSDVAAVTLSPALFSHLTQQMTHIVDSSLPQRLSAAELPTLSPVAAVHLSLLYHTIDQVLLHCIPLLRPTPRHSVQLLEELVATWIDAVLPSPPPPSSSKPRAAYVPAGRYSAVHRSLAMSLWPSVVWCVSEMGVSPIATANAMEWTDRLRGLVALTKREAFWPHKAGVSRLSTFVAQSSRARSIVLQPHTDLCVSLMRALDVAACTTSAVAAWRSGASWLWCDGSVGLVAQSDTANQSGEIEQQQQQPQTNVSSQQDQITSTTISIPQRACRCGCGSGYQQRHQGIGAERCALAGSQAHGTKMKHQCRVYNHFRCLCALLQGESGVGVFAHAKCLAHKQTEASIALPD